MTQHETLKNPNKSTSFWQRVKRRLGSTALVHESTSRRGLSSQLAKRYEGTSKQPLTGQIETDVRQRLSDLARKNLATYETVADKIGSPQLEKVRSQQEALAFAYRAEKLFDLGNNQAVSHPYGGGVRVNTLRHELDPGELPEWAVRDTVTSTLTSELLNAYLRRSVKLRDSPHGETVIGAPRYELVVSNTSRPEHRSAGVTTVFSFDCATNYFSAESCVRNLDNTLHGKPMEHSSIQKFPKAVSPQEISELL